MNYPKFLSKIWFIVILTFLSIKLGWSIIFEGSRIYRFFLWLQNKCISSCNDLIFQQEVFTVFTTEYVYCRLQCTDSVWQSFTACLRAHNSLLKEQTKLRTQRLTSTLLGKIMNSQSPTEHMSKGTISTYWIYETASYTEHWPFLPRPNVRWEDKLDELGQPQGRVTADSAGYWNSLCRAFWMPCSVHQDTRLQKAANKFDERGWSPASSYRRTGASCSDMCQVSEQGFSPKLN